RRLARRARLFWPILFLVGGVLGHAGRRVVRARPWPGPLLGLGRSLGSRPLHLAPRTLSLGCHGDLLRSAKIRSARPMASTTRVQELRPVVIRKEEEREKSGGDSCGAGM